MRRWNISQPSSSLSEGCTAMARLSILFVFRCSLDLMQPTCLPAELPAGQTAGISFSHGSTSEGMFPSVNRPIDDSNPFRKFINDITLIEIITLSVSRRRRKMNCGHARLCVCLCVCLSAAVRPHYCTDPDVTWRHGRGAPLVVHYWADLQSGHRLRCYGNITRTLVTSLRPSRDMTT